MKPIFTNENGDLLCDSHAQAVAVRGSEILESEGYIPMPKGATFTAMPGRVPLVKDQNGKVVPGHGTAVAVLLPQGFTRTMLPATETMGEPAVLPLLGYTAAAMDQGKVYVAAKQTDEHRIWHPDHYNTADLPDRIRKVKKALKG
ncbi:MAG: radical SAM protein, partial [Clostridia bacterium]